MQEEAEKIAQAAAEKQQSAVSHTDPRLPSTGSPEIVPPLASAVHVQVLLLRSTEPSRLEV